MDVEISKKSSKTSIREEEMKDLQEKIKDILESYGDMGLFRDVKPIPTSEGKEETDA